MHTATHHGRRHPSEGHPFDSSDLCLLRNLQGIIYLYAKVSHRRFQLGVSEQQLHGSKVFCTAIDQRRLGPLHRMGPILGTIQTKLVYPVPKNSGVLPRTQVRRIVKPTGEKKVI